MMENFLSSYNYDIVSPYYLSIVPEITYFPLIKTKLIIVIVIVVAIVK